MLGGLPGSLSAGILRPYPLWSSFGLIWFGQYQVTIKNNTGDGIGDGITIYIFTYFNKAEKRKKANQLILSIFTLKLISLNCKNVIPFGFEPKTAFLEGRCSIQLSYGTKIKKV